VPVVALMPHPSGPATASHRVTVDVRRPVPDRLRFGFVLAGDLDGVRIPDRRPPGRTDRLWEHTCFEAFVAPGDGPAYRELNLSPSGEWAAYAFADYRRPVDADLPPPRFTVTPAPDALRVDADWTVPDLSVAVRIGVSAVVEQADGTLVYWALRHPAATPDFHHADAFALRLETGGA
jgi:hypothetical protein